MVNVCGMPTHSIATSTPASSVTASTCAFQSGADGVDRDRRAQRLRDVEPVAVRVDGDDLRGSVEPRGGDRGEADRSGSDDGDGVTGLDVPVPHTDLEPRRQDVGEQHGQVVGHVRREAVQRAVRERHANQLGLGPVDEVAEHPADARHPLGRQTVRGVLAPAVGAHAAPADARDDHALADSMAAHAVADRDDRPDPFVPEHPSVGDGRDVAVQDVQVGAADGGGVDLDHGVGRFEQTRVRDLLPRDGVRTVEHERLHGDSSPRPRRAPLPAHLQRYSAAREAGRADGPVRTRNVLAASWRHRPRPVHHPRATPPPRTATVRRSVGTGPLARVRTCPGSRGTGRGSRDLTESRPHLLAATVDPPERAPVEVDRGGGGPVGRRCVGTENDFDGRPPRRHDRRRTALNKPCHPPANPARSQARAKALAPGSGSGRDAGRRGKRLIRRSPLDCGLRL